LIAYPAHGKKMGKVIRMVAAWKHLTNNSPVKHQAG
jgi:hypothetical protein